LTRELCSLSLHDALPIYDAGELVGIGLRRHAVTEVEHVALGSATAFDDVAHVRLEHRPRRLQQSGVDVALHGDVVADDADRLVQDRKSTRLNSSHVKISY